MTRGNRSILPAMMALLWLAGSVAALAAGPTVRGRVISETGTPLPEARVYLIAPPDPATPRTLAENLDRSPAKALTDADGYFSLPPVPAGLWFVRVEAPGFVPATAMLAPLLEDTWLPEVELARARDVKIRVETAAGEPLAGARVRTHRDGERRRFGGGRWWRAATREAFSDGEGLALVPLAAGEILRVSASHADHGFVTEPRERGGSRSLRLPASPRRTLTVIDHHRRPVANATLSRDGHPLATSGPEGKVSLPWPDEEVEWTLAVPGGRRATRRFDAPGESKSLPWALPSAGGLAGRLIDAERRTPIAGGVIWPAGAPDRAVVTDEKGLFAWPSIPADAERVQAGATGYLRARPVEITELDRRQNMRLALRPAATVTGKVADVEGQGIAGAALSLHRKPTPGRIEIRMGGGPVRSDTITDPRGRFRLTGVDPGRNWILGIEAEGFAPGSVDLSGLEPYQTKENVAVTLERGAKIAGRVVDRDGEAIPGARVVADKAAEGGPMMRRMSMAGPAVERGTDADREGNFVLEALPAGKFDVTASSKGFASRTVPGVTVDPATETAPLTIELTPGERLQGMVLGLGDQPLEGAQVFIEDRQGAPFRFRGFRGGGDTKPDAVTGADGWFYLHDLAPDAPVSIRIERAGYVDETRDRLSIPQTEMLIVNLAPSSTVRGKVVDDEGVAVPGAQVSLSRSSNMSVGGMMMMAMQQEDDTTDEDGRFLFEDVSPGSLSFRGVAPGYRAAELKDVELKAGEDLDDVLLRLEPGATLEGVVTLPDGSPAIGARVDRVQENSFVRGMSGAVTDGAGRYRLDGLEPGPISIEARHREYPRAVRDVELEPGMNALDLQLAGGQPVRGLVRSEDGTPVAGARVDLTLPGRFWGGFGGESRADGTFSVEGVQDGRYAVRVTADGYAASGEDREIEVAGAPVEGIDVVLSRGGAITGTVEGVRADDFGRVSVRARHAEGRGFLSASVDFEGRFRMENAAAGRWTLTGEIRESGRRAEGEVTLEPGAPEASVTLAFGGGVTLTGRATQADAPVRDATVALEGTDVAGAAWTETDADGRFRLEGLEPGRYRLALRQWETGLTYTDEVDLTGDRDLDLDIPTATVAGRVRDALDGSAISGVTVTLEPLAEGSGGRVFGGYGASSDQDGRFRVRNVTDGRWNLVARKGGYAAVSRTIDVASGRAPDDLDLRLDATEGLVLRVSQPRGAAPDNVQVAVLDALGNSILAGRYDTGENGRLRLPSVPAGSWEVLMQAGGSAVTSQRLSAPSPETPVMLQAACSLLLTVPALAQSGGFATATITDAQGRPFRALNWFGALTGEFRLDAGRAELRSLPPGSWTVVVRAGDGTQWQGTATTAPGVPAQLTLE